MKSMWKRLWFLARTLGLILILAGMTSFARADEQVPEIDPGSMASALTLLCGGVLILTGRRKRS
ncbi:MAG: hypothetical protein ACP5XB_05945 [Isosphaeraceae bacterium]